MFSGETALQLKDDQKGLGSGPAGLGILSNCDEIRKVYGQTPRGFWVVLVASLTVQARDKAEQVGAKTPLCPLPLVQRGIAV